VASKAIYENCRMYYQGQLLALCAKRRAEWYLNRGLATKLSDDPLTVELLFKPNQRLLEPHPFFLAEKENICVVCGVKDDLTLHHVVPYAYRRLLPDSVKKHNCHDVLILCVPCHRRYETVADGKKKELISRYNLSKDEIKDKHIKLRRAQGVARKLLSGETRCRTDFLLNYLGKSSLDKADLESIIKLELPKIDYYSLSDLIVPQIEDIQAFIEEWRQHFVSSMKPGYLPNYWDINFSSWEIVPTMIEQPEIESV
jgi:5-methylcytosine-specific restriction endonuclease McrA